MKQAPKVTAESAQGIAPGLRKQQTPIGQADQFRRRTDENRIGSRLIPPAGSLIFDRKGVVLAQNEQTYRIVTGREKAGDGAVVLDRLGQLMPLTPGDIDPALTEFAPGRARKTQTRGQLPRIRETVNASIGPGYVRRQSRLQEHVAPGSAGSDRA